MTENIFFVRHGEAYLNLKENNQRFGRFFNPLTDEWLGFLTCRGKQQSACIAKTLRGMISEPPLVISSTMSRAKQTADYIADAFYVGSAQYPNLREQGHNPLNGVPEDMSDVVSRFSRTLETIVKFDSRPMIIVSHKYVISGFLGLNFKIGHCCAVQTRRNGSDYEVLNLYNPE